HSYTTPPNYQNQLQLFPDLADATADLHNTLATTARPREMAKPVVGPEAAAASALAAQAEGRRVGIVFGPERTGLTNDELLLADALVSYPVNPEFSSLNMAQAVLLFGYVWYRQIAGDAPVAPPATAMPATKAELGDLVDHLVRELDAVNFFRVEERRASLIRTITVLLERRQWNSSEVQLMRGIIKDLVGGRKERRKASTAG
ncbi:MAG: RNA methyltransferase, partial [Geminicoccaceae bacterium]